MMNKKVTGLIFVALVILAIGLSLLANFVTLWLWNYVMPTLNIPALTYWKMYALVWLIFIMAPRFNYNLNKDHK